MASGEQSQLEAMLGGTVLTWLWNVGTHHNCQLQVDTICICDVGFVTEHEQTCNNPRSTCTPGKRYSTRKFRKHLCKIIETPRSKCTPGSYHSIIMSQGANAHLEITIAQECAKEQMHTWKQLYLYKLANCQTINLSDYQTVN